MSKIKGDKHVTLCFFGDSASNQGTFHEAVNMAAAWKLPVVFLCENNSYGAVSYTHLYGYGEPTILYGPIELTAAAGMICHDDDGNLLLHVHMSMSDQHGTGHGGCLLYTSSSWIHRAS